MSSLILFNKPYGVICQFSPSDGKPTLKDFIAIPDVYPAGRLDTDSEGLVLLTADGGLQHRISDPQHKLGKSYWVQVEGIANHQALEALRNGLDMGDFVSQAAKVKAIEEPIELWPRVPAIRERKNSPTSWLEIEISEGKNRQVRRMTAKVGLPTLRLIRHRIGSWDVSGLAPGQWRFSA